MVQTDESRLITGILDGRTEDFSYFLERYGNDVYAMVLRLVKQTEDAEDLTQEIFIKAFSHLGSFDGRSSFSTWIYRIAYNEAVGWLRKQRVSYLSVDDVPSLSDAVVDEALSADREEMITLLENAIGQLRPEEQTLITLFYYEDKSVRDIGYILGIEPNNVTTKLHRIRRKLYLMIKDGNIEA